MIPLSVKIRTHAVSSCGPGAAYDDVPATMGFDGVKVSASAHGRGESSRPRGYQNARKKASNDHFLDEKTPGLSRECIDLRKKVTIEIQLVFSAARLFSQRGHTCRRRAQAPLERTRNIKESVAESSSAIDTSVYCAKAHLAFIFGFWISGLVWLIAFASETP